jgi:hypothetical protein
VHVKDVDDILITEGPASTKNLKPKINPTIKNIKNKKERKLSFLFF